MRKSCVLCGHIGDVSTMKYMSPAKKLNLVMTASLSLIGVVNRADVDTVEEEISKHNRRLCHSHVAQAARYLSAEMAVTGKRFS
ncbi:hypothetical protein GCK32_021234 [Trichostrongylus colubriformis]|uniref:Uncharacterized protein n=1 Tax=Trichostrongylus colubriformis TaxID=6319 RepID=A0AAN8IMC3_TRICO